MAGQNLERREVLRALALAAAAAHTPGFVRWTFAYSTATTLGAPPAASAYEPRFFRPEEMALLTRLTEIVIPSDDTPGAREAGVSEFIDFMVWSDPALQYRFRYGLSWMEAHARHRHRRAFLALEGAQQEELIGALAYKARWREGEEDGRAFFALLRDYTVMGYYTSKVGMEALGAPGLRQHYPGPPGCPHPDDPAHRRLSRA